MKIGIIGAGKRFFNVYRPILEKMGCSVFLWNRTKEKIEHLRNKEGYTLVDSLEDFEDLEVDACLCFLPPTLSYSILSDLQVEYPLLLETPIVDQRWAQKENIGVLEQWIYLPIEQFKEKIYQSGIISRPYWVFNDGRSFEYHAIAQLRKYCQHQRPKTFKANRQTIKNSAGFIDKNGKKNFQSYDWLHGAVTLNGGTFLTYNFSYSCKMTNLKPFQMLRSYSSDGSITSGRSHEMDNDYELFEIRFCDERRNVVRADVERRSTENTTTSLSLFNKVEWKNKYSHLNFDDQQTAIAYLIDGASKGNFYPAREGYIDNLVMSGMKQAAHKDDVLKI